MLVDPYGRRINYLRISVTDKCNLRCRYCMPGRGITSRPRQELLSFEEIVTIVKAAVQLGIENIRVTGGEPLIRKELANLISSLNKIAGIKDISLTTNGILLREYAVELKRAGLKRLNISLDSLIKDRYKWITRKGNLSDALRGIKAAFKAGFSPIKINVLLLDEMSIHEIPDFLRLTIEDPFHIRFLEFMPIGSFYKMNKFISGKEVLEIARTFCEVEEAGIYGNGPAKVYRFKRSLGTFGIIAPLSDKFCADCNRLRLTSDGSLKVCLHSHKVMNLRDYLRSGISEEGLIKLIKLALNMKPKEHFLDKPVTRPLEYSMCQVGG